MKTILVTGGSRGIGRAIVEKFAKEGYNVVVNYNKSEYAALDIAKQYKNVEIFKANVSNPKDVEAMVNFAEEKFKKIDVLVNNAGISSSSLLQDLSLEEWNNLFEVNVTGTFLVTKALAPTTQFSPIVILGKIFAPAPILVPFFIYGPFT